MDFPFADAPGIIRANQKDKYVENDLYLKVRDLVQSLKGVRFTHNWTTQIKTLTALLYLGLTTLSGSRTLGEEYTDIFHVTNKRRLPSKLRLIAYVVANCVSPLIIPKLFQRFRAALTQLSEFIRTKWVRRDSSEKQKEVDEEEGEEEEEEESWIDEYVTPASIISINLAFFYFTGAYYQISKRICGLRYVFGYRIDPMTQPTVGYQIIGFLMATRALFRISSRIKAQMPKEKATEHEIKPGEVGKSLADTQVLSFIEGNSRNCHLCYEPMRAPTITLCGHIYCWSCISDWCRDQRVCPLCRQECHEQHLLSLRV